MAGETQPHGSVHTLPGGPARGDTTKRTSEVLPLPGQAPALPDRIGGYRVLRELGRGGMGVVYLAENLGLRRQVALKVLAGGADLEAVERFQLEARAAARVKHPNVVGVHEVGRDGDRWFLAMDLVDGESLRARVQRDGPLEPREAARIVEAVARALHEAHTLGVLHRDVKPHNILLERDGTPLLADFGLARDTGQQGITVTGEVMGTPAYMAPEQAAGDRARIDRRADVYAAGATLYEALTGQPPFQGPTALHILAQVTADAPRPPSALRPGLDRELETVVLKCLEKEPDARYDTAGELADDLGRWLRHEPLVARRPGLALRAAKLARRRPWWAALGGLAAMCALAVGAGSIAAARERARAAEGRAQAAVEACAEALAALEVARVSSSGRPDRAQLVAYQRAGDAAQRWCQLAPDDPAARRQLLETTIAAGHVARTVRPDEPNRAYALALELSPGDPERRADHEAAEALTRAHELFSDDGDRDRADAALAEAQRLRPGWAEPWLLRSRLLRDAGDPHGALAALDTAIQLQGERASSCLQQALALLDLGDPPAALQALDRAVALEPDGASALACRAVQRLRCADFSGAVTDLNRLIALEPRSVQFRCQRAEARFALREPAYADDYLDATHIAPGDPRGWIGLSQSRSRAGLLPQALAAAERAVEVAPRLGAAWLQRGRMRQLAGDVPGAIADLAEATRLAPGEPAPRDEYAGLLIVTDPAAAVEVLSRSLATAGPVVGALTRRAEAWRRQREFQRALQDANAAIALAPQYHDAWAIRGYVHANLERVPEAIQDLETSLRLAPDQLDAPALREALDMLRRHR